MQTRSKFFKKRVKGNITLFSALMFMIVSILIIGLIHSAIFTSCKTGGVIACKLGIESAFAGYNNDVFERYGIYCLSDTRAYDRMTDVIKINAENVSTLKTDSVEIKETVCITDAGGLFIYKEALDYMKGELASDAIDLLKDKEFPEFLKIDGDAVSTDNKKYDEITEIPQKMKEISQITDKGQSADEVKELFETYRNSLTESDNSNDFLTDLNHELDDVNTENSLQENQEKESQASSVIDKDKYNAVKKGFSLDLTSIVLGDKDISDKFITESEWKSNTETNKSDSNNKNVLSDLIETVKSYQNPINDVIFRQYLIKKFPSYTDRSSIESTDMLDYQLEYILGGMRSDKENLNNIISKIMTVRTGYNLIYLFTDTEKREEAKLSATAVFGWLGPVAVKIGEYAILSLWSYAESIADTKALLYGYKIPIIKDASSWQVSIGELVSFNYEPDKDKCVKGLDYTDYLFIFMNLSSVSEQSLRAADVIELNMISKGENGFSMSSCIFAEAIEVVFSLPYSGRKYMQSMNCQYSDI